MQITDAVIRGMKRDDLKRILRDNNQKVPRSTKKNTLLINAVIAFRDKLNVRCQAQTKKGTQCRNRCKSELCHAHSAQAMRCRAITRKGTRCKKRIHASSQQRRNDYCRLHAPPKKPSVMQPLQAPGQIMPGTQAPLPQNHHVPAPGQSGMQSPSQLRAISCDRCAEMKIRRQCASNKAAPLESEMQGIRQRLKEMQTRLGCTEKRLYTKEKQLRVKDEEVRTLQRKLARVTRNQLQLKSYGKCDCDCTWFGDTVRTFCDEHDGTHDRRGRPMSVTQQQRCEAYRQTNAAYPHHVVSSVDQLYAVLLNVGSLTELAGTTLLLIAEFGVGDVKPCEMDFCHTEVFFLSTHRRVKCDDPNVFIYIDPVIGKRYQFDWREGSGYYCSRCICWKCRIRAGEDVHHVTCPTCWPQTEGRHRDKARRERLNLLV